MKKRFSSLTKVVLAIAMAGCARVEQPTSGPAAKSRNYGVQPNPSARSIALTGNKYRNADGSMDYNAMRQVYGEPNTNLTMNPRATDVAKTPSVGSVAVHDEELVFAASDAQWLLTNVRAGDTLYCGSACPSGQFLRNVVSVTPSGNEVVVATTVGGITDILQNGWIHGTQDVIIDFVQDGEGHYGTQVRPRIEKSGTVGPTTLWSTSKAFSFTGGSVTLGGSITAQLNYDVAVSVNFALPPISLDTLDLTAVITPAVSLKAEYSATASFSKDTTLFTLSPTLPPFTVGPVEVTTTITLTATAHADASGTITLKADGTATDAVTGGFTYTSAAGANPVFGNQFSDTYDISATGQADAHASVGLSAKLAFNIYSVAGPYVEADATIGAQATATANADISNKGSHCSANISANLYFTIGGNVGLALTLPYGILNLNKSWPLPSKTWNFPDPAWTQDFALNDAGTCFAVDAGPSGTGSTNGSSGSSSSGGSTGTTSTTHGTNGSFGACGANGACSGSEDCCSNDDGGASQCIDTSANSQNCSGCGQNCVVITGDPTSACQSGTCSCTCPAGTTHAGQACTSTDTSACDD